MLASVSSALSYVWVVTASNNPFNLVSLSSSLAFTVIGSSTHRRCFFWCWARGNDEAKIFIFKKKEHQKKQRGSISYNRSAGRAPLSTHSASILYFLPEMRILRYSCFFAFWNIKEPVLWRSGAVPTPRDTCPVENSIQANLDAFF